MTYNDSQAVHQEQKRRIVLNGARLERKAPST